MSQPVDLARRGRLRPLSRRHVQGPFLDVARALLGCLLVREEDDGTRTVVRLVETEGYVQHDPASHSYRGRTPANATMFGPAGHAYVYFTYGMHHCMNVTCGMGEVAAAVLLRGGLVLDGLDHARERRPAVRADRALADGPAKLASALGLDRTWDGVDLCDRGRLWLGRDDVTVADAQVRSGPRVGIRHAPDEPWRFWVAGATGVSTYRRHPRAPRGSAGF